MYDVPGVKIAFFGGQAPLEARGSIGPYQFFFRAKGNEWEFAVATDVDANPATFDIREQIGFGIFGNTATAQSTTGVMVSEVRARRLLAHCIVCFQDISGYLRSVGILREYVQYRSHVAIEGYPELEIEGIGGNAPVQAHRSVYDRRWYLRARHDGWLFAVATERVGDPTDVNTPRDGFCVFDPYGLSGGEDASWMPEEVALSLIIRGARCFLAMATLFEPQLDDA